MEDKTLRRRRFSATRRALNLEAAEPEAFDDKQGALLFKLTAELSLAGRSEVHVVRNDLKPPCFKMEN